MSLAVLETGGVRYLLWRLEVTGVLSSSGDWRCLVSFLVMKTGGVFQALDINGL